MSHPASAAHPDRKYSENDLGVLVGWTHRTYGTNLHLRLQSTRSEISLETEQINASDLLMTHNQALLLAHYLLRATEQTLPEMRKPSLWHSFRRLFQK
jgi:hypothetical protein